MMNKKIFLFFLMLIVTLNLTGCQLAVEDGAENKSQDKLIGAYVSFDYIDLFDFEGYINNNHKFSGEEIKIEGNTKKYEGRMYATRKDEVKTSSQGEKYTETNFVFEQVDGIGMFSPTITDPLNENLTYTASSSENGFCDVKKHIKSGDNEDGLEIEATVYISSGAMSSTLYINPVYQSADGSVYLVSGQGFYASGENGEGEVYSQKITDTASVTENGKSKSYSASVNISIASMNPTEKVTIIQMDKNSNILKKTDYNPEAVPENLTPEKAADYIIVESIKLNINKQQNTERTLFSKNDNSLWFFRKNDGKVLVKSYTTILWDEVQTNKSTPTIG